MFTIDQLLSFKTVFETGGYSSAGRIIGKDRTTVREHVIALEIYVGKTLFNVQGKSLIPTDLATHLYPRAKHLIKHSFDFECIAFSSLESELMEIVISYETFIPVHFLAMLEQKISARFPLLVIKLLHKNRSESMLALNDGSVHLSLMAHKNKVFASNTVGVSHVGHTLFSPYASPQSHLFEQEQLSLLTLSEELQYVSENIINVNLEAMRISNTQHVVSNNDLIISLIARRGWSVLNRLDAKKYEQAGWIKELKLKELMAPYSIGISLFESLAFETNSTIKAVKKIINEVALNDLS